MSRSGGEAWRHPRGPLEWWQRLEVWESQRLFLVTMARGGIPVDGSLTGWLWSTRFWINCLVHTPFLPLLNLSINLTWQSTHLKELIFEDEQGICFPSLNPVHGVNVPGIIIPSHVCVCKCLQPSPIFSCEIICILWPDAPYKTRELMLPNCGSLACDE